MEIHLDQGMKIAEIWLTNADQNRLSKTGISGGSFSIRQSGSIPADVRSFAVQPKAACPAGGCTGQLASLQPAVRGEPKTVPPPYCFIF